MTLKQAKQALAPVAAATVPAVRRVYVDLTGTVDAGLEALARARGLTKKGTLEALIIEAVQIAADEAAGQRKGRK